MSKFGIFALKILREFVFLDTFSEHMQFLYKSKIQIHVSTL